MKEIAKTTKPLVESPSGLATKSPNTKTTDYKPGSPYSSNVDDLAKKMEGARVCAGGDVAAGLPTREMRNVASQYKRDSLASSFKLNGSVSTIEFTMTRTRSC